MKVVVFSDGETYFYLVPYAATTDDLFENVSVVELDDVEENIREALKISGNVNTVLMTHYVATEMTRLVDYVKEAYENIQEKDKADSHCDLCRMAAEMFNLWQTEEDGASRFPTWLSRVVSGVMADVNEGVA